MSLFSQVKSVKKRKNNFNLSHDTMLACEMGQIVPCYVQENILPNSHLKINSATLFRMQALLAPLQHHVNAFIHFWWIPTRLIDSYFPQFISGEMMRTEATYDPPYFTYKDLYTSLNTLSEDIKNYVKNGTLLDFLGYPIPQGSLSASDWNKLNVKMSIRRIQYYLLPIYYKYLNENINFASSDFLAYVQYFCNVKSGDSLPTGNVSANLANLLIELHELNSSCCFPHAWQKDYFTSALPFVQMGDPVTLPLGGTIPVSINGAGQHIEVGTGTDAVEFVFSEETDDEENVLIATGTVPWAPAHLKTPTHGGWLQKIEGTIDELELEGTGDLSEATAVTINELRIANALQSLKEAYARFGTRFNEWLLGFWGQVPDDASLQMPLWLGGGKVPVNISDIEQTSATANSSVKGATTPQGNLAGKAVGFGGFKSVNAHFKEPGCVIGFLFIQPKAVYGNQGLNRFITKLDNIYDYFNPMTEHLGEQAVLNQELYYGADTLNGNTFGYQSRYAEYKYMPSEVHGQFMDVLNFWHMARIFSERPTLSPEFIYTQTAETKRPFAVQQISSGGVNIDISSCLMWIHFDVQYTARMSKFGTPMLLN